MCTNSAVAFCEHRKHSHTHTRQQQRVKRPTYITMHTTPLSDPRTKGEVPTRLYCLKTSKRRGKLSADYPTRVDCTLLRNLSLHAVRVIQYPVSAYTPFRPYNHGLHNYSSRGAAPRSSLVVPFHLTLSSLDIFWVAVCMYISDSFLPPICLCQPSLASRRLVHACMRIMYVCDGEAG